MNFKLPKLRDHNGDVTQRWAVYWYVLNQDDKKWVRCVEWISGKIADRKARYLEAEKIIKEVTTQLKSGNYEVKVKSKEKLTDAITQALEFKKKYVSPRTYYSYQNICKKLGKWINKNRPGCDVDEFTNYDANQFIDDLFSKNHYEPKTINSTIGYLHIIFTRIGELYPIGKNPFKIAKIKENEPEINIWNNDYKTQIANHLREYRPELFTVLLLVYHCYLRPDEIRQIQVKDINITRGTIRVSSKKGKSNHVKYPTLSNQLKDILTPFLKLPPGTYLFSNLFKPGNHPISRNRISEEFKKERRKIGIPDDFKLYSFKHTGNSEMIEKNLNIRELQAQNGHSNINITEKYLRRLNDFANQNIVELTNNL